MEAANLDVILARFAEHWSPKKIAQVNDYDVGRIVKIHEDRSPGTGTPTPMSSS